MCMRERGGEVERERVDLDLAIVEVHESGPGELMVLQRYSSLLVRRRSEEEYCEVEE